MRFRSPDGEWVVDVLRLSLTGDHRDGERFRVTRYGFFVESSVIAVDRREPQGAAGVLPCRT